MAVRLPVERRKTLRWLVIVTVVSLLKFYAHELVLGQVNILFAVVATGAFLAMKAKREVLAGVLVVLAIVIKPYAVLFVPWLIARRQLPSIASACAGLALVLVLPAALYGWDGNVSLHREWWRTVTETTAPNLSNSDNVSLAGNVLPLGWPGRVIGAPGVRRRRDPSRRCRARLLLAARRARFPRGSRAHCF